jgi:ABC-2 type transport system ATP-binding protein
MSNNNGHGPAVEVAGLVKQFGAVRALDGLSITIPRGIIYGLLGPNGSGKTTLIRALIGLVRPTSGSVRVMDHDVLREAAKVRAGIGYMTQSPALYNDLSVGENVDFSARIFGLNDGAKRKERISQVLQLVGLEQRASTPVSNLSGGLRQRALLACALVHQPSLLLLDEPTVGVDPQLRHSFWRYFRTLADSGVTLIVSSHVMDEAERCDRLGLMLAGRLLAEGTAAELRARAGSDNLEDAFLVFSGTDPLPASPAGGGA